MLYTHRNLHVAHGEDAGTAFEVCGGKIRTVPPASFARDGYCILRGAVPTDVVDAARRYVASHEAAWRAQERTRPDDWRMHFEQRFNRPLADGHAPVLDLLRPLVDAICGFGRRPVGVFYTQLAYRSPSKGKPVTAYHIDGEANADGDRFPDHFSLIVGVALSRQLDRNCGNFTVFPGAHTARNWTDYPDLKRRRALPDVRCVK